MPDTKLTTILEAILFTASEPLSIEKLAEAAGQPTEVVQSSLLALEKNLTGGIRLAHTDGTYRLVTAPEASGIIRKYLEDTNRQDLSRPALETLAIVAYRGPITKSGIE